MAMATTVSTANVPYFALATVVLVGNVYVCYLFFSTRSLRNATNKFVVSSAFCDILVAVLFVPFYVVLDKQLVVDISGYVASLAAFCSLFNLVALTFDRAVAIFKGLRYIEIMHTSRVRMIIAMVWIVSLVICILPLAWLGLPQDRRRLANHIYQGVLTILLIVPNCAIFAVYIRIFKVNRHHLTATHKQNSAVSKSYCDDYTTSENLELSVMSPRRDVNNFMDLFVIRKDVRVSTRKRASSAKSLSLIAELKAAKVIAAIFLINCICWLPVIIINVCDVTSPSGLASYLPAEFIEASKYFFVINSAVNPFIYAFCKKDFRRVIRKKMTFSKFK